MHFNVCSNERIILATQRMDDLVMTLEKKGLEASY